MTIFIKYAVIQNKVKKNYSTLNFLFRAAVPSKIYGNYIFFPYKNKTYEKKKKKVGQGLKKKTKN